MAARMVHRTTVHVTNRQPSACGSPRPTSPEAHAASSSDSAAKAPISAHWRQRQAQRATEYAEQHALSHELPDDSRPRRAERRTRRESPRAEQRPWPGGDWQYSRTRSAARSRRRRTGAVKRASPTSCSRRGMTYAESIGVPRELAGDALRDHVGISLRLLEGDAVSQPGHDRQIV